MYISKYLAYCGVCARRKAAELIKNRMVEINGKVVDDITYFVQPTDVVKIDEKTIKPVPFKYILLNKPKDYITTLKDEKGRRTVLDLIRDKSLGRVYPVGRLDRMTTGLLLLTNDGDLAQKLSHPKFEIFKEYVAELERPFTEKDMLKLRKGLKLDDGYIKVDRAYYLKGFPKEYVGIELHSGKNRIVRRIFERLGYRINKLDRVKYAGLSKKGLTIGRWRFLTREEVESFSKIFS